MTLIHKAARYVAQNQRCIINITFVQIITGYDIIIQPTYCDTDGDNDGNFIEISMQRPSLNCASLSIYHTFFMIYVVLNHY